MITSEFVLNIARILAGDKGILTFCHAFFGRGPTIYVGIDTENPAPEEDYPVIAIVDIRRIGGEHSATRSWAIDIGCGVISEDIETGAGVKQYAGFLLAEDLRDLVEEALMKARLARVDVKSESESIQFFPKFVSYTTATISEAVGRRR